jgi:hypothetical protein
MAHLRDSSRREDAAPDWLVWPELCSLEASDADTAVADALSGLLNTINCLPGVGILSVVVTSVRVVHQGLPFIGGYVPPDLRTALTQGMLMGGGCKIRLRAATRTLVFGVCLGNSRWSGCSDKQIGRSLALQMNEIAASFPAVGTVERIPRSSR